MLHTHSKNEEFIELKWSYCFLFFAFICALVMILPVFVCLELICLSEYFTYCHHCWDSYADCWCL